jgi:hypothetical protein
MPGIVPKNISTRQSGQISSGTQRIGNTKSSGSSTRMVSHCKSNSDNQSNCINTVLNLEKPKPQIVENIQNIQNIPENDLFNRKSFYQYFHIIDGTPWTGIGPPPPYEYSLIDTPILNMLNQAANRWARYIKHSDNAIYYIRAVHDPNWNGIELKNFLLKSIFPSSDARIAQVTTFFAPTFTAMVTGFELFCETKKFLLLGLSEMLTVLTHELGHALGTSGRLISRDTQFKEILPLVKLDGSIQSNPRVLKAYRYETTLVNGNAQIEAIPVFQKHVGAYIGYGGIGTKQETPFPLDQEIDQEIVQKTIKSDKLMMAEGPVIPTGLTVAHLREETLYTKNWNDPDIPNTDKYYYLGFANEIMNGEYSFSINGTFRYYISMVSIGRLLDLRSETSNGTIYTYDEISADDCEILEVGVSQKNRLLVFKGIILSSLIPDNNKSIKDFDNLFCNDCSDENQKDIKNDIFFTCTDCCNSLNDV